MAKLVFFYAIIGTIMLMYCSNAKVVEGELYEIKIHRVVPPNKYSLGTSFLFLGERLSLLGGLHFSFNSPYIS